MTPGQSAPAEAPELLNPLRYWTDQPQGFPSLDEADADADREDSLSARHAFQLGEDLGIHRLQPRDEWPDDAMAQGYTNGLTRPALRADVYRRKLLGLRISAFARGLPFSSAIDATYLRSITVTVCPVSGTPLTQGTREDSDWSIDRLANGLGYVPGNMCVLSTRVNQLKGAADLDELVHATRQHLLRDGFESYGNDVGNGLRVVEALRLAALVAAPSGYARGKMGDFAPMAQAPGIWITPQCRIGALHVACARTRIEGPAQRLRAAWFKRLGKETWRQSNRLVEWIRSHLIRGMHPCDLWLLPEATVSLVELISAFFANPPALPGDVTPDGALASILASIAPVAGYERTR